MPTNPSARDAAIRAAAFKWLEELTAIHGDVLPWALLLTGFMHDGRRVPLVIVQGVFKLAVLPEFPDSMGTSWRPSRRRVRR